MKRAVTKGICYALILLMLPCCLGAQSVGSRETYSSARNFVEEFYQWYVPRARRPGAPAAWYIVRKRKRSVFSPRLAKLLKEDSAAQAECEELVGLDFDPILNTQDPAARYEVGEIRHKGKFFLADVYSVRAGKRSEKPSVVAELTQAGSGWHFVNFCYSNGQDLLTILKPPRPPCTAPRPSSR